VRPSCVERKRYAHRQMSEMLVKFKALIRLQLRIYVGGGGGSLTPEGSNDAKC
jgi:hypothetical protein